MKKLGSKTCCETLSSQEIVFGQSHILKTIGLHLSDPTDLKSFCTTNKQARSVCSLSEFWTEWVDMHVRPSQRETLKRELANLPLGKKLKKNHSFDTFDMFYFQNQFYSMQSMIAQFNFFHLPQRRRDMFDTYWANFMPDLDFLVRVHGSIMLPFVSQVLVFLYPPAYKSSSKSPDHIRQGALGARALDTFVALGIFPLDLLTGVLNILTTHKVLQNEQTTHIFFIGILGQLTAQITNLVGSIHQVDTIGEFYAVHFIGDRSYQRQFY